MDPEWVILEADTNIDWIICNPQLWEINIRDRPQVGIYITRD